MVVKRRNAALLAALLAALGAGAAQAQARVGIVERRAERRATACAVLTACVFGAVEDSVGRPLGGAYVSLAGTPASAFADNGGRFALGSRPGRYQLFVRAVGYAAFRDSIDVTADAGLFLRIRLVVAPPAPPAPPAAADTAPKGRLTKP